MIGYLVLLFFVDASSFDVVQLFVVNADSASPTLLDADAASHVVCLLVFVADVDVIVVGFVLFLPDDVLHVLQVEEDVEEDVSAPLDVLISGRVVENECLNELEDDVV